MQALWRHGEVVTEPTAQSAGELAADWATDWATIGICAVGLFAITALIGGRMFGGGAFKKEYLDRFKDKRLMVHCHHESMTFAVYGVAIEINEAALVLKDGGDTGHIPFGLIKYITEKPA